MMLTEELEAAAEVGINEDKIHDPIEDETERCYD
jgi:hypothetical protein